MMNFDKILKKNLGIGVKRMKQFDPTIPSGYSEFDAPDSRGKIRSIKYRDPEELTQEVEAMYGKGYFDAARSGVVGDESSTSIPEFKKLVTSEEKILPPVVLDRKDIFFEGRHRLIAAKDTGTKIPVIELTRQMSQEEKDEWKVLSIPEKQKRRKEAFKDLI